MEPEIEVEIAVELSNIHIALRGALAAKDSRVLTPGKPPVVIPISIIIKAVCLLTEIVLSRLGYMDMRGVEPEKEGGGNGDGRGDG